MSIAVRYYSRSGNTKAVAEAIADAAGVAAVSVDQDEAFYVKSKPDEAQLKAAADFARKYM